MFNANSRDIAKRKKVGPVYGTIGDKVVYLK